MLISETLGVFIAPFIVGIFLYFLAVIVGRLENTPIKIGLLVWLCIHYRDIALSGIDIFDLSLTAVIGLVFITIGIANNGKIKFIRYKMAR